MSKRIFAISFAFYLTACTNSSSNLPVAESEYSTKIIGNWEGTANEVKETMSFNRDSTFVFRTHRQGFIANTLSQSLPGIVRGKWRINGKKITMEVTGEKNELIENQIASNTIIAFKQDSLVFKSDVGDVSAFRRDFKLIKNN